jgi:pimeloyl-[acyl-carrier protein] methyl ester esterase
MELVDIAISKLPVREPYILLAESFSGPIALRAAAQHTNPPVAVILCASFAKRPFPYSVIAFLRCFSYVFARFPPPRWIVRRYLVGQASDELMALFYRAISSVAPSVLTDRVGVILQFNKNFSPARIQFPLLYLQATQDLVVGPRCLRVVQQCYPFVQVARIESPHLVLQVQPQSSVRAILEFLKTLS